MKSDIRYLIDNYNTSGNFSESISRQMPHKYLLKHKKDTKGKNAAPYKSGLDLVYDIIFEGIDAIMYGYDPDNFQVFNDYIDIVTLPTNSPACMLEKRERVFDPTILDIIDSKYFNKGQYFRLGKDLLGYYLFAGERLKADYYV